MAFNGAGIFSRLYSWTTDKANSIKVLASRMDAEMDGMATGLSSCLVKDGQQNPTANLPMATKRHTGVGDAAARTDYAAAGQIQDGGLIYAATVGGTGDAIVLTLAPAITAYAPGAVVSFIAGAANTGATTVNINSVGVQSVVGGNGSALVANEIVSGQVVVLVCKTATLWQVVNKVAISSSNVQSGTYLWGGTSGGSANAQTITLSPVPAAYAAGQTFRFIAGFANTSSITLNVNGLGAKTLKLSSGAVNLRVGDIIAGGVYQVTYDGTNFVTTLDVSSGTIVGSATTTSSTQASTASTIPFDNTKPQSGEGAEYTQIATSYTPVYASSLLEVTVFIPIVDLDEAGTVTYALFKNSDADAVQSVCHTWAAATVPRPLSMTYIVAAGSTSAATFKLRYGADAGTAAINSPSLIGSRYNGAYVASMTIKEIRQ
ncbi:hypothetical protein [Sphingomonas sp.]|jgi:hypothetical protein|uniref:hypothetical protein n=1 Tax=Sphingomonas sp. TaxID=28214 RepID=UPI003563D0D6